MSRIKEIQNVNDSELKLITHQTQLLLQKRSNGQNGELKTSGYLVENYVKELVKKHIPDNYKVCSGYIATTETIDGTENLIQHDLIIVDKRIPSLYYFGVSDIEIVSAESVCGIIEIKRTLNDSSIAEAISHLENTKILFLNYRNGIKSKQSSTKIVGSAFQSSTYAPLYAIIGLNWSEISDLKKLENSTIDVKIKEFIDMIWPISSEILYYFGVDDRIPTFVNRNPAIHTYNCRKMDDMDFGKNYRFAIALLRTWISHCTGIPLNETETHEYFQSFK